MGLHDRDFTGLKARMSQNPQTPAPTKNRFVSWNCPASRSDADWKNAGFRAFSQREASSAAARVGYLNVNPQD
jgi:hypothetical protein